MFNKELIAIYCPAESLSKIQALAETQRVSDNLVAQGIQNIEIVLRSKHALIAIETCAQRGDLSVWSGSIITPQQALKTHNAGAKGLFSPGITDATAQWCIDKKIPFVPGVASASEVMHVLSMGLTTMKMFPAMPLGGTEWLTSMAGPLPQAQFIPTGGVTAEDVPKLLSLSNVVAVGGSFMVNK